METNLASEHHPSNVSRSHGRLNELVDRATRRFGCGDYGGTRDALLEALELNGEQVDLILFLGNVYHQMRDLAAARGQYERAVELDPAWVGARISLAGLLAEQEQFESAEVAIRAALGFEPDNRRALRFLAGLLLRTGRVEEANETFAALLAGVVTSNLAMGGGEPGDRDPASFQVRERLPLLDAGFAEAAGDALQGGAGAGTGRVRTPEEDVTLEAIASLEGMIEGSAELSAVDKSEALGQVALLTQLELGEDPPSNDRVETAFEVLLGTFAASSDGSGSVPGAALVGQLAERFRETASLRSDLFPIPVPSVRAAGATKGMSMESFIGSGVVCQLHVRMGLELAGEDWAHVKTVLDFGCGCGRVLRTWTKGVEGKEFYGTDVDPKAIGWCTRNLPNATSTVNEMLPPLRYSSQMFDLVYSFFGFPRRDEKAVFHWLGELKRVVRPGGVLVLAVHPGVDPVRDLAARFFEVAGEVPGTDGSEGLLVLRKA